MDEWMGGVCVRADGWLDGQINVQEDECLAEQIDEWMDRNG